MTENVLRRARQSDEKPERRRQILAAAEALFAERGGELPSVQAMADRAGVAKGTLYLYFATVRAMSDARERLRRSRPPLDRRPSSVSIRYTEAVTNRNPCHQRRFRS